MIGLASLAFGEVIVLIFIPLHLNPPFQKIVNKPQNVALAALFGDLALSRSTIVYKVEWPPLMLIPVLCFLWRGRGKKEGRKEEGEGACGMKKKKQLGFCVFSLFFYIFTLPISVKI